MSHGLYNELAEPDAWPGSMPAPRYTRLRLTPDQARALAAVDAGATTAVTVGAAMHLHMAAAAALLRQLVTLGLLTRQQAGARSGLHYAYSKAR